MFDFAFIADRYNYWIFIVLMMTGLYIVISRGNLVKKIIGLNVFQTSVFIYYISIGKIAGGTAPILIGGEGGHGEEVAHGAEAAPVETAAAHDAPAPAHDAANLNTAPNDGTTSFADAIRDAEASTTHGGGAENMNAPGEAGGFAANDLSEAVRTAPPGEGSPVEGLHSAPQANPPLADPGAAAPGISFETAQGASDANAHAAAVVHQAAEIVYTNPLPHVLILTAIVVGVATTAVGLALAVRIREAYGTIEEDELEAADDIAEFGRDLSNPGAAA